MMCIGGDEKDGEKRMEGEGRGRGRGSRAEQRGC